jgi:quinol monooxygenase YgiN
MIISILEGRVTAERWEVLEQEYRKALKTAPIQLKQTYLIQDEDHLNTWRIISIWRSKEDYEAVKGSGKLDTCAEMFRKIGVEPTRQVFKLVAHHEQV